MRNKNSRIISSNTKYCPTLLNNTLTTCACYAMIQVQKSDCRKTLVGASIARPCPFALQKTVPEKALLRPAGGRPMVAPTHAIRHEYNLLTGWPSPSGEGRESLYNLTLRKIPLQNLPPRFAVLRHCLCAVLAQADAVAVAVGGENKRILPGVIRHGERRAPQTERTAPTPMLGSSTLPPTQPICSKARYIA